MAKFTQSNRQAAVTSPLGADVLLLTAFSGEEAISRPFRFLVNMVVDLTKEKDVHFEKLLGQKLSIRLSTPDNKTRHLNGIVQRIHQGEVDTDFASFAAEIVPQFSLLERRTNSRIFQQKSVPDILKKVLEGLDVSWQIQGTFHPRNYVVQYRETDFAFVSRLMEEEGIYYFFTHTADGHKMVVANTPQSHPELPLGGKLTFEKITGGARREDRILSWSKVQELKAGKITLWDHSFEFPGRNLEAGKAVQDEVKVGQVTKKIKAGQADTREIYDYPGFFANRFDGVNPGGGEQPADVQKIFQDNERTVGIRAQEEVTNSVVITATSTCRNLVSGHKFNVSKQGHGDGDYLITSVKHSTGEPIDFRSGSTSGFQYQNEFTCIPLAVPYRPARKTPRPLMYGNQTATVVGPKGEEIFTDKYGRVKVQFHWDRQGKKDPQSSCWVRVGQLWAGKRWGASFYPRIGQEVIVAFLEGNPDQPIIVGSVYNAEQMPPYLGQGLDSKHANDNKVSGIKTNTTPGGKGYNELRFDDTKDKEQVFIHAERNYDQRVKASSMTTVGGSSHLTVGAEKDGKKTGDIKIKVVNDFHHTVGNDEIRAVGHDLYETVKNNTIEEVSDGGKFVTVPKGDTVQKGKAIFVDAQNDLVLHGKTIFLSADTTLQLAVGNNFIKIDATGVTIVGTLTKVNCPGDMPQPTPPTPPAPSLPGGKATLGTTTLKPDDPAGADNSVSGMKSAPG